MMASLSALYPGDPERDVDLPNGARFHLRPIKPEDEAALCEMIHRSSSQDRRSRFLGAVKELPHLVAARLVEVDADRQMSIIALDPEDQSQICGVVHLIRDPSSASAEFAVMVRSDLKGHGLGYRLMLEILGYAASHGITEVYGEVLAGNTTMLQMAKELGARAQAPSEDPGLVRVSFKSASLKLALLRLLASAKGQSAERTSEAQNPCNPELCPSGPGRDPAATQRTRPN